MKVCVLLFAIVLIATSACKKEKQEDIISTPHNYSSSIYRSGIPSPMGGCLDSNENLLTFHLPLLANTTYPYPVSIPAEILLFNNNVDSLIINFGTRAFSSGHFGSDTINSIPGWTPRSNKVSLAYNKRGWLFMAHNRTNEISLISGNMTVSYKTIYGLTAMTSYGNDLYAMSTNIYDGNGLIIQDPIIHRIDSFGILEDYYDFPANIIFNHNCGTQGGSQAMYPIDVLVDMKFGNDSSLYIACGYDNVIYKLDKNKNLSRFIENIFCPVSIDFDNKGQMFIVSAPKYEQDSSSQFFISKPVEVYLLSTDGSLSVIYSGNKIGQGGCLTDDIIPGQFMVSDANFNINVTSTGSIFLENPLEKNIILIQ